MPSGKKKIRIRKKTTRKQPRKRAPRVPTMTTQDRFEQKALKVRGLSATEVRDFESRRSVKILDPKGDCWVWDGAVKNRSRGTGMCPNMWDGKKVLPCTRIAWKTYRPDDGTITEDGKVRVDGVNKHIVRTCQQDLCVAPHHLGLVDKAPVLAGATHPQAVLTEEAVLNLRTYRKPRKRVSLSVLSDRYGVSREAIRRIVSGESSGGHPDGVKPEDAPRIREEYEPPRYFNELANLPEGVEVSKSALASAASGRTWRYLNKTEDDDEGKVASG
jgi:hypothetical protein